MIVRARTPDDLPALVADLRATHERDGCPVREQADPAACATLRRPGRPVERLSCLTRLVVVLGVRGTGVGAALLDTAVERARRDGRTAVLEVSPADVPAVTLHWRQGWRDAGPGPARWWVPDGGRSLLLTAPV